MNDMAPDGELFMREVHHWASEGSLPVPAHIDVKHLSYQGSGLGRWVNILGSGQLIYGNTRDLPESEQVLLAQANILSMVLVPIFVGGHWWGYIGFDERERERDWSMSEIDALKAAANTLGAALPTRHCRTRHPRTRRAISQHLREHHRRHVDHRPGWAHRRGESGQLRHARLHL